MQAGGTEVKKTEGYIGLDVGSSGCKAAVLDLKGNVLVEKRREYNFEYPSKGRVELNPVTVWKCVKEVLTDIALEKCNCKLRMIAASSIGESMVMVDDDDNVLYNGIMYLDERGTETIQQVNDRISLDEMYRITGLPPRMFYSLNRILWMQQYEPQLLEKTAHYFLFEDYITYMLSGEKMVSQSSASKTWMMDVKKLEWSDKIGKAFHVPLECFSKIVQIGTIAGNIRPELALETGLPENIQIVVGCHDQCAATLGSGCISEGDVAAGEGSTESLNLVVAKDKLTDDFWNLDVCLEPYIVPGTYMIPVGQHTHGTSLRWFANQFAKDLKDRQMLSKSVYDILNDTCAEDSGEVFFLPYLTRANLMDAENRSLGAFIGMEVGTTRECLYRAVLEGISFETRFCLEIMKMSNLPVERMIAAGGCSKSDLLMQLKADVLGCNVSVLKNTDAGISALAMICAVADGVYSNYEEAVEQFIDIAREHCARHDMHTIYDEKYRKYMLIRETMKQLYTQI